MYCQNCGSEIEQNSMVCPFCGELNRNSEIIREKDAKILEMEQKIAQLEQRVKQDSTSGFKRTGLFRFQWMIFVFPLVFVVVFFLFFILLVSIR